MDILNQLSIILDWLISTVPKVVALASITAAFLPTGSVVSTWVNRVAFNFKNAENKE